MTSTRHAVLLVTVFAALWAVIEAMAARILRHYSPYQVVWVRYAVHLMLMLIVWGPRAPATLLRTHRPVFQMARSILMLIMPASWIIATQSGVDQRSLMTVFWLSPLMITALAALLLGERIGWQVWLSAGAASTGAAILLQPESLPWSWLLILPLAMGLSFSLYVVMTRSLSRETYQSNLFYTALGVFLALSPFIPQIWMTPNLRDFVLMAGIGVLGFVALLALDRAAANAPVSATAPLLVLQLAFTMILEWARRNHPQDFASSVGFFFICSAAALSCWVTCSSGYRKTA
jgi:drug/metabolite transporter (DMT)-like permease